MALRPTLVTISDSATCEKPWGAWVAIATYAFVVGFAAGVLFAKLLRH